MVSPCIARHSGQSVTCLALRCAACLFHLLSISVPFTLYLGNSPDNGTFLMLSAHSDSYLTVLTRLVKISGLIIRYLCPFSVPILICRVGLNYRRKSTAILPSTQNSLWSRPLAQVIHSNTSALIPEVETLPRLSEGELPDSDAVKRL